MEKKKELRNHCAFTISFSKMLRIVRRYSAGVEVDFQKLLREDLKTAMRNKAPAAERTMIRTLLSELKNLDIDNNGKADRFAVWGHLKKLSTQRSKTAEEYLKPGQPDRFKELAEVELAEEKVISQYLERVPVASKEDIRGKVVALMKEKGLADDNKQAIFKAIPWAKVQEEWNASRAMISEVVNEGL